MLVAVTERVFADALRYGGPWPLAELTFWRWRAGLDSPPLPDRGHPYALQIAGDWGRAAERWTEIGCPYEAALALGDADDEHALRRAIAELEGLGAKAAVARVESRLASGVARS